jgi:cytosine/adenosine deaminase-related metal-dependent hydrolase
MPILLKNATFIDWRTLEFSQTNVLVEPNKDAIQFVTNVDEIEKPEVIDCTGKLVTKSFAVGHHHAYSALARGMGAPQRTPQNFHEVLQYIWWTLDKCLDLELIEMSALVTAMACAKAGSTFVIDHHASPNAVKGSLGAIARAFDRVGVSHLLCYEISDRDGPGPAQEGLDETGLYLQNNQGLVGLHASFTVGNATLERAVGLMQRFNSGIHIHVAEDMYDQDFTSRKHGLRVVERLFEHGAISSPKSILVHCLHLNDHERDIIRNSPCWVAQNTESNLNNNVGYFSGEHLGKNIMLGTDGMHSDMLRSAKAAFLVGQGFDRITPSTAYERFRNVHRYLGSNGFRGDGDNNLVVLDYDSPTEINQGNFLGHLIFGINSNHVRDVISNGRLILRNRQLLTVNEEDVLNESKRQALRLWARMK